MHEFITIFENDDFLVIEKPYGLVVNRSDTHKDITLQDLLENKFKTEFNEISDPEFRSRSGIVHRLDKDTSGLLLVAKNIDTYYGLQELFKNREVEKKYLCVVLGEVSEERFEIDAPIARNPDNRFKYAVVRDGKEAQTYFEKIKDYEIDGYKVTSLFANPRTGRTHQIRVHLAAYGNPVLIDPIYMSLKEQELAELLGISRLMLHALSLKFKYNDKEYFFETKIPEEFKRFIN